MGVVLKASDGLSKLWPSVAFFVLLAASMAGLMFALKTLPVGPAYAVWVGHRRRPHRSRSGWSPSRIRSTS